MKWTYLLIDMLTVLPPLAFSFYPRIRFYRQWGSYLPATAVAAVLFLAWDSWFTRLGIWGFNSRYLTGLHIGNLPIEEWLFFLCIPYACIFTLHCLKTLPRLRSRPGLTPGPKTETTITWSLVLLLVALGICKSGARYTAYTSFSLAALLLICRYGRRLSSLGLFYAGWLLLMIPMLLVDGLLTGTGLDQPVVWYRYADTLGIRLATIPLEDFLYGMELILLNLFLVERFENLSHLRM